MVGVIIELIQLELTLCDISQLAYNEWKIAFIAFDNVSIHRGRFEEVENFDCMVSPANSFGLMDGGIDAALIGDFGEQLRERVQVCILKQFHGEQPVGTSMIVPTDN